MLKIVRAQGELSCRVRLYGEFTGEYVPEVEKSLAGQDACGRIVALDLSGVTFVDRAAMLFLCGAESGNVALENVPSYVARWMEQEVRRGPAPSGPPER